MLCPRTDGDDVDGIDGEGAADFMADFKLVFKADPGVFKADFGSGVVSGGDFPIFRADFNSPGATEGLRADLGFFLFISEVDFKTDFGATIKVVFILGVRARDGGGGVPKEITLPGVLGMLFGGAVLEEVVSVCILSSDSLG